MANTMKKTNNKNTTTKSKTENIQVEETIVASTEVTESTEEIVENEKIEEKATKQVETVVEKKPRKYEATDGIPCKSITPGGLYMEGIKSHILYEWADNGDVTEVEYQDLVAAIRSNVSYIHKPYFIIEDEDIVAQFPQINKIYESMYSIKDLKEVLTDLSPRDMKATILTLPEGAKESIKHIASQMISNGSLDSVQKIKFLDEIFDTRLMLMTELFS